MTGLRALRATWAPRFRRLDHLPLWQAWAIGLAAGALAGAALASFAPAPVAILGFLGLLGAVATLAWSGEPLAVAETLSSSSEPVAVAARQPSLVDLVSLPGGTFRMGSPESEEGRYDDEGPIHEVRLSPFECMRFPVTRRLYRQIIGIDVAWWPEGEADERPVNNIHWFNAVAFCNLLSAREGLTPCYQIHGDDVTWQRAANGYRLLTEAEWEYACRARSITRWSFGEDEASLADHAWFSENSSGQPHPVGHKRPNARGLHDMHGNVCEWCWDWFGPYSDAAKTDPYGAKSGAGRVLRGGAFDDSSWTLRSARRLSDLPVFRNRNVGFRCARSQPSSLSRLPSTGGFEG